MTKYLMFTQFYADEEFSASRSQRLLLETSNPKYILKLDQVDSLVFNVTNTLTGKVTDTNGKGLAINNITITIELPRNSTSTLRVNSNSQGIFSYSFVPTRHGTYTISAVAPASADYGEGIDSFTTTAGIKDTIITIQNDSDTYVSNNIITTKIILSDVDGNPLKDKGVAVYLDNATTPTWERRTNNSGIITITHKVKAIGTHSIVATWDGVTNEYSSYSTSPQDCTFEVVKHKMSVIPYDHVLYPGWRLRFLVKDEADNNLANASLHLTVNNTTYDLTADSEGFIQTPELSLPQGDYKVTLTGGPWTYYEGVNYSYTIQANNHPDKTVSVDTILNKESSIPYRIWNNLDNVKTSDSTVATCGKKCTSSEALGGSSGSWNTPAPLRCTVSNSERFAISEFRVRMNCRTVSCSSASAKPKITAPSMEINGNSQSFVLNTSDNQLPFPNHAWIECNFNINYLQKTSQIVFDLKFPKNGNGNFGLVEIKQLQIVMKYTPTQEAI